MNQPKRKYPPLTPDDTLRFGKHKGKEVWQVIEDDPDWLRWAMENIGLELDNEAFNLLQKKK